MTKFRKLGFLDFPDTVRKQIYELAIYDHDRTAVFLPRALPRKVVPGLDDVDIECTACVEDTTHYTDRIPGSTYRGSEASGMPCEIRSTADDDRLASGTWLNDYNRLEGAYHSLESPCDLRQFDDEQILELLAISLGVDSEDEDRASGSDVCIGAKQEVDNDDLLACADLMHYAETVGDSQDEDSDEDSLAPNKLPTSDFAVDSNSDEEVAGFCETGACEDPNCLKCCDHPTRLGEYCNDSEHNVFHQGDNIDLDDEDHFDPTEQIGMLYEPHEPHILLVSKQVRAECLPIYYGHNAFSWRFQWADYLDSCVRFKSWAKSIDVDNMRLLTKLTFQGRHAVEEGSEFSADIDLLNEHPFFETNVFSADDDLESARSGVVAVPRGRRRHVSGGIDVAPCDREGTTAHAAGHTPSGRHGSRTADNGRAVGL